MSLIGVRTSRNAPLRLAACDQSTASRGDLVLLDVDGTHQLGFVVLASSEIIDPLPETTESARARVVAVGRDNPDVRSALEARRAGTRAVIHEVIGSGVEVVDVDLSDDLARLTVLVHGNLEPDDARRRLAARFRASIRLEFR